jgi:hypothetical protein
MGKAFEYAFASLMSADFNIELRNISEKNKIYDFEYKTGVVIEAKGSPDYVPLDDGTRTSLNRAGMKRTDTDKKAFDNATKWRRESFRDGRFYIVTNAIRLDLMEKKTDFVSGVYDITKKSQLDEFVRALTA